MVIHQFFYTTNKEKLMNHCLYWGDYPREEFDKNGKLKIKK